MGAETDKTIFSVLKMRKKAIQSLHIGDCELDQRSIYSLTAFANKNLVKEKLTLTRVRFLILAPNIYTFSSKPQKTGFLSNLKDKLSFG